MTKIQKIIGIVIAVIVVGLLFSAVNNSGVFGGVYNNQQATGVNGTLLTKDIAGRVNCAAGTATLITFGANTYECNVNGVRSGDTVVVTLGNPVTGLTVGGAYASTTANNYFRLVLQSTASTTVSVGTATTSVSYRISK